MKDLAKELVMPYMQQRRETNRRLPKPVIDAMEKCNPLLATSAAIPTLQALDPPKKKDVSYVHQRQTEKRAPYAINA